MLENKYTPERRCLEGKILSFVYPLVSKFKWSYCFTAQFKSDQRSPRELLRALPIPSISQGLLWGTWDGIMCTWIPQGGGETLNKPSLLSFCPCFPISPAPLLGAGTQGTISLTVLLKPCVGSVGHFECAESKQRVRFSSEAQDVLKYLQAKESNNFSSYFNGSTAVNFYVKILLSLRQQEWLGFLKTRISSPLWQWGT